MVHKSLLQDIQEQQVEFQKETLKFCLQDKEGGMIYKEKYV